MVRDGEQKRVCLRVGFIPLELLDQHIRLSRIGPAKDRPSGSINIAKLIAVLLPTIGTIAYLQFLEDSYDTAGSFQTKGGSRFHSDPSGKEVEI